MNVNAFFFLCALGVISDSSHLLSLSDSTFSQNFSSTHSNKNFQKRQLHSAHMQSIKRVLNENKKLKILLQKERKSKKVLSETFSKRKMNYLEEVNDKLKIQISHYKNQVEKYQFYVRDLNHNARSLESRLTREFEKVLNEKESQIALLNKELSIRKSLPKTNDEKGSHSKNSSEKQYVSFKNKRSSSGYVLTTKELEILKNQIKGLHLENKKLKKNKAQVEVLLKSYQRRLKILKGQYKNLDISRKKSFENSVFQKNLSKKTIKDNVVIEESQEKRKKILKTKSGKKLKIQKDSVSLDLKNK